MPGTIENQPASHETLAIRGVYLLTHPRSASNLFQTMMSKQPGFQSSGYKLFSAGFATLTQLGKGPISEWEEEERKGLYKVFETGFEDLQDELADAKKNVSSPAMRREKVKSDVGLQCGEIKRHNRDHSIQLCNGVLAYSLPFAQPRILLRGSLTYIFRAIKPS
jgi:hypothetical protein